MALYLSNTTICRVGYCELCAKEGRPHTGNQYLVIGATGYYHVYEAKRIAQRYGYCPHLYRIVKIINDDVIVDMCCSMYECGVYRKPNAVDQCWDYMPIKDQWRRTIISLPDWNALVSYKHDWQYEI